MEAILQSIQNRFFEKEKYFIEFAKADTRIEGWFKAELILLLNELREQGKVENFKREAPNKSHTGHKKIDFNICLKGEKHLCELKALCISQADNTPRNLNFYFKEDDVGMIKDFRILDSLPGKNKWVLGFIYPKPTSSDWDKAIRLLPLNLQHWQCITNLQDFPAYLFISVWKSGIRDS